MKKNLLSKLLKSTVVVALAFSFCSQAFADDILVFGASGNIGSKIVREALDRGHQVYGVSRSPEKFEYTEANFHPVKGDPTDIGSVAELAKGKDAIINAVGGRDATDPKKTAMNLSAIAITTALAEQGENSPQVVVIGGGLTMHGSPEKMKENLPPVATEGSNMYALFMGHWETFETYKASNINWTILAPPMNIIGWRPNSGGDKRTGEYRVSSEDYVRDADGNNQVYVSDLAFAALDFAETGKYNKLKVTIGN